MIIDTRQLQDGFFSDAWDSISGGVSKAVGKETEKFTSTVDNVGKSADSIAKTTTAVYNDYQSSKPALAAFFGLITIAILGYVIETSIDIKQKATKGK